MTKPASELYDIDARNDPLLADYERARDLLHTSDWRQGLKELERLAHCGSIMSMLLVADAMRKGWLYDQDLTGAEAWFQVAVESGSARGLYGLGLTRRLMGRFNEAIKDLEAAIARGFPPAYNALAGIYFLGEGVPADRRKALELYRKGASLGHLLAKRNLVQQSIHGRFGSFRRIVGILTALPFAFEYLQVKAATPYTDRLR